MRASWSVNASFGQHQAFDGFSANDVRFDDFFHVGGGHVPVPDRVRINDDIRPVLALIEAARLIRAHASIQAPLFEFLLKELL